HPDRGSVCLRRGNRAEGGEEVHSHAAAHIASRHAGAGGTWYQWRPRLRGPPDQAGQIVTICGNRHTGRGGGEDAGCRAVRRFISRGVEEAAPELGWWEGGRGLFVHEVQAAQYPTTSSRYPST